MKYWFQWNGNTMWTTNDPPDGDPRAWKDTGYYTEKITMYYGCCEGVYVRVRFHWYEDGKVMSKFLGEFDGDHDHEWKRKAEDLWLDQYEGVVRGEEIP